MANGVIAVIRNCDDVASRITATTAASGRSGQIWRATLYSIMTARAASRATPNEADPTHANKACTAALPGRYADVHAMLPGVVRRNIGCSAETYSRHSGATGARSCPLRMTVASKLTQNSSADKE